MGIFKAREKRHQGHIDEAVVKLAGDQMSRFVLETLSAKGPSRGMTSEEINDMVLTKRFGSRWRTLKGSADRRFRGSIETRIAIEKLAGLGLAQRKGPGDSVVSLDGHSVVSVSVTSKGLEVSAYIRRELGEAVLNAVR